MQIFDCLDQEAPILGPHLLEASAGTGKTFAIEHVVLRLLLQGRPLESILVLTFTNAATLDLLVRIRSNLHKACSILEGKEACEIPYLREYIGKVESIEFLRKAKDRFSFASISTIHAFCYQSLCANSLIPQKSKREIDVMFYRFCETTLSSVVAKEQVALLWKKEGNFLEWKQKVLEGKKGEDASFFPLLSLFEQALLSWKEEIPSFEELLHEISRYKKGKKDPQEELRSLRESFANPEASFRKLLLAKGEIFATIGKENRKKRETGPFHPFFLWAEETLSPLVRKGSCPEAIWGTIRRTWETEAQGVFSFDSMLEEMAKKVEDPHFCALLREKYTACIVDEFQDTDPLQWKILETLFVSHLDTLYFVGDPKQSIYRFRSADVYTYFRVKELLGSSHTYQLATNYRSSAPLLEGLHALFARDWLFLPQKNSYIPYFPVLAGKKEAKEDSPLYWMVGEETATLANTFLPYIAREIQTLDRKEWSKIAILVKDRYQREEVREYLEGKGISVQAKEEGSLAQSDAFTSFSFLFSSFFEGKGDPLLQNLSSFAPASLEEDPRTFWQKTLAPQLARKDVRELVEKWLEQAPLSSQEYREWMASLFLEDPSSAPSGEGVQILTQHASKGLEFSWVFALGLHAPISVEDVEEKEEILRQLYVVMTRAKERLYVPLAFSKKPTPLSLFRDIVEKEEGDFLLFLQKHPSMQLLPLTPCEEASPAIPLPTPILDPPLEDPTYCPKYIQSFSSIATHTPSSLSVPPHSFPAGKETGVLLHRVLQKIFEDPSAPWKRHGASRNVITSCLEKTTLAPWEEEIASLVEKSLSLPLGSSSLSLRDMEHVAAEVAFVYPTSNGFMKGFLDLVAASSGKLYFFDWKTHPVYSEEEALLVMERESYYLQAALYRQAIERLCHSYPHPLLQQENFGGAFYLFLRAPLALELWEQET